MISLTFSEIFKKKPFHKIKYEKLILNLSGENSFSKKKAFENLISVLQKSKFKKIIILGKTYDKNSKQIINSVLKTNNKTKIKNIFDKTNFLQSTKLIDKCCFYIGFDTGLSNYAVESGKNALIISASGMPGKFFPRTTKEMKNESYWVYNTPCADCNYSGYKNSNCLFNNRVCFDEMLLDKEKIEKTLKKILDKNFIINFQKIIFINQIGTIIH